MLPAAFRARKLLATISILAVGLALGASVAAVLGRVFSSAAVGALCGASSTLIGAGWAALLRSKRRVTRWKIRLGWVVSPLFAIGNSALAAGLLISSDKGPSGFVFGAFAGATFGVFIWLPALIVTLVCFGFPIAAAQREAAKGLAGEERGDLWIGAICAVIALLALAVNLDVGAPKGTHHASSLALSIAAIALGGATALVARGRQARRRDFVARVEAGSVEGFRVDPTPEGKVLLRVSSLAEGYRVADYEQALFELDAAGEAKRPKRAALELP